MSLRMLPSLAAGLARAQAPKVQLRPVARMLSTTPTRASALPPRLPGLSAAARASSSVRAAFAPANPILNSLRVRPHSQAPSPRWGPSSFTASFLKRAFGSSRGALVRQTYFPRGGSGGGGKQGPFQRFRAWLNGWPEMTIVYGLIGVNVAIYLLWQYAISSYQRFRDPSTYQFMVRNFILNEANIMAGRIWTLVTCCFSHSTGSHIFMNCLGLYFIAPAAAAVIGGANFLGLYLAGGIFSSLCSLLANKLTARRSIGSEGASGAIYTCLSFYAALFPRQMFLFFFVIPMPAWLLVSGIFAWDLFGTLKRPNSGVDSAGHVGGIVAGVTAAMMLRRGRFPGMRQRW